MMQFLLGLHNCFVGVDPVLALFIADLLKERVRWLSLVFALKGRRSVRCAGGESIVFRGRLQ